MAPTWRTQTAQLQGECAYLANLNTRTVHVLLRTHTYDLCQRLKGIKKQPPYKRGENNSRYKMNLTWTPFPVSLIPPMWPHLQGGVAAWI